MQRKEFLLGLAKIGAAAAVLAGGKPTAAVGSDEPASKPRPLNSVNDVKIHSTLKIGQMVDFGPDEVPYSRQMGVLYGGIYKYVRFRSGMKALPGRGLLAFWDTSVDENQYQVTCDELIGSSPTAGIVLNNVTMSQDEGYYHHYSRNENELETPAQNVPGESNGAGIKQKY